MAKTADASASTFKERKPPKKLSHIEVHEAENGGHLIRHIHTDPFAHKPEEHVFGASESMKAHEHIAKTMSMPMTAPGAENSEEE
jgi:hypothetical protein